MIPAMRAIRLAETDLEMLLFDYLQEFVYFKDAEELILRPGPLHIGLRESIYSLEADAAGEILDPERHHPLVDVKAVTFHRVSLKETGEGWRAFVILDI
ncbi:MAG TPA: archease [Syntrophales bacterium]|nr:archease [Syntrophales bacterium]